MFSRVLSLSAQTDTGWLTVDGETPLGTQWSLRGEATVGDTPAQPNPRSLFQKLGPIVTS